MQVSSKRLVRSDSTGVYVITGGYTFRPGQDLPEAVIEAGTHRNMLTLLEQGGPVPGCERLYERAVEHELSVIEKVEAVAGAITSVKAGDHVNAVHIEGTPLARVNGETWLSESFWP